MKTEIPLKSALLIFFYLIHLSATSQIVGGYITNSKTSDRVYTIEARVFRDCAGLQLCAGCQSGTSPVPCNLQISAKGGPFPIGVNHNLPAASAGYSGTSIGNINLAVAPGVSGIDVIQMSALTTSNCTNCNTRQPGSFTLGAEVYRFTGTLNLSSTPTDMCWVSISYQAGLRRSNSAILANSGSLPFISESFMNTCVNQPNSSPTYVGFEGRNIVHSGYDTYYNMKWIDPDGDSISYRLGAVTNTFGTPVTYITPYSPNAPFLHLGMGQTPNPPLGINFDPINGFVQFRPLGAFKAPLVVEVLEWRKINGVPTLIGLSKFEFEINSLVSPNNLPSIDIYNNQILEPDSKTNWNFCSDDNTPYCLGLKPRSNNTNQNFVNIRADSISGVSITKFGTLYKTDSLRICFDNNSNQFKEYKPLALTVTAGDFLPPYPTYSGRTINFIRTLKPSQLLISGSRGNYVRALSLQALNSTIINPNKTIWQIETAPGTAQFITRFTGAAFSYSFPSPGIYKIKTIVEGDCITALEHTIEVKNFAIKDSILNHIACKGQNTGKVVAVIKDPIGPVQYKINNGAYQTNQLFENLGAGTFKLYAKDSFNQIDSILFTLTEPQLPINVQSNFIIHPNCNLDSNGTIEILAGGGIPPYVFGLNQNAPSSNNTFNNLPAGKYLVKVMDQNNCIKYSDTIALNNPTPLNITFNTLPDSCHQIAVGIVTAIVTGGMPNYAYNWLHNPILKSPILNGLRSGKYPLKVTDSKGCTKIDTATIPLANLVGSEQICAIHVPDPTKSKQEIIWFKTPGKRIANYQLWEALNDTAPFTLKATIPAAAPASSIDSANYSLENKQYKIRFIDSCGRTSSFSIIASPLRISIDIKWGLFPELTWTTPQMNSSVLQYQIFRKGSSGVFNLIKTLGPSENNYIDSFFVGQGLNFEYYLRANLSNNCQKSHINSAPKTFTTLSLKQPLNMATGFVIYPNPAQQSVTVKSLNKQPFTSIQIRSIEGKLIETYTFQQPQEEAPLRLPQLSKGLYHLFISSEGKTGFTLPLMISY